MVCTLQHEAGHVRNKAGGIKNSINEKFEGCTYFCPRGARGGESVFDANDSNGQAH